MHDIKKILQELDFDEKWFELGFVSSEDLIKFQAEFRDGEDTNKEHYRWRAFTQYLEKNSEIEAKDLREFYRLGEIDADGYGVGMSMKIKILQHKDCPDDLIIEALNSGEKALIKVVERKMNLKNQQ